jgi:H+-transporting ATPase
MSRVLGVSAVLGFFSIVQSVGWLTLGLAALRRPEWADALGITGRAQLQTLVFLQLVVGGHLLLLVTRTERWFFQRPFPAWQLFSAIVCTQLIAVLICGFGWFVPALSMKVIALTWAYNLVWMGLLGAIRILTEGRLVGRRPRSHHAELIGRRLHPHQALASDR